MGVSLSKGGNVSLNKEAPGLTAVLVGLGWDVRTTTGTDYDLDASALLLDASGKVPSDQHFVFQVRCDEPQQAGLSRSRTADEQPVLAAGQPLVG
ncbi:TerD family protein, partial [Streptomyces massasporeus]|uniref:TerD family protein n=1 Tax=Streptomyces massasporeus TaxID=67324 RepID=UPI0033C3D089